VLGPEVIHHSARPEVIHPSARPEVVTVVTTIITISDPPSQTSNKRTASFRCSKNFLPPVNVLATISNSGCLLPQGWLPSLYMLTMFLTLVGFVMTQFMSDESS